MAWGIDKGDPSLKFGWGGTVWALRFSGIPIAGSTFVEGDIRKT
jgi:hypothetical protein